LPISQTLRRILLFAAVTFTVCIVYCLVDAQIYQAKAVDGRFIKESIACNNGAWLRYYWYRGKHNEQQWLSMLERLKSHKVRYAYFHVLGVNPDGRLQYHQLKEARQITSRVHQSCPDTECIAWVYVPSDFASSGVDLSKKASRIALHKEAQWLIEDCGFDGVQWDYEFAPNDDKRFLDFLSESRALIPRDKLLSIATPMSYPLTMYGWNDAYFKKVAPYVDQIAVMSYDSFLYLPRAYGALVARQVVHVSRDAAQTNPACKIIIGLPTYEDRTFAHQSFCESFANSLRGFEQGLRDYVKLQNGGKQDGLNNIEGVAVFADYTTDEEEWKLFDQAVRK
jgi:hypothetical protein